MTRCFLIAVLLCAPLAAQLQLVGQDGPDFHARTCVNPVDADTMAKCKGGVVLLKYWGPK